MAVTQLVNLDDCFQCGGQRWEPRRRANGEPYLKCVGCGYTTAMPRQLQFRLPLKKLPRDGGAT